MKHLHSFAPKRLLAAAAAGVLSVCVLLPAGNVLAAETTTDSSSETFDDGTLTYKKLSNTTVSVTDCVESATHISIMPKIDGYDVVSIGEEAFANCTSLQGLTIPDSVTEIGSAAFYGCTALESLTVPDSVTKIESGTFFNCSALTNLTLGGKTTDIGDMAFGYCTSLETVALPETVENMGNQVFYYCTALDDISIPDKVTELGSYTFYGCLALKSFEVPANLEDIGAMSFVACPSLETITVADGNAKYTAVDNVLYDSEESILYLYPAGRSDTSFTLPDSTLVVYAGAFFAAGNLQQITFDEKLQYIGEMAFDFCSGLTSLNIPKGVTTIGTTAFADCTGLTSVTFDGASDEDGGDGDKLEIGDYAFFCTDNLKEVQLPKRVSSIGKYAFGCTSPSDDDDSEDYVTVSSDSGDDLKVKALSGFLLIGYTRTKEAVQNSFRALWMNLLGGLGFAAAIFWAGVRFGVTDLQSLILCDGKLVVAPVILLAFAALTKSAQLPFSRWLLGAMVAPTPSSALLHSATMVKAGVYLLIRLAPVMYGTYAGSMVSLVGGFTFLITSMLAITVSDGKAVLAYSTISNLGLIAACAGVGRQETVWAAVLLLIFHAVSKSLLFQTVGAIENATGSRDIESMHGLIARHPRLALTLSIGIAGMFLAPFGMLISKWAALKAFVDSGSIILVLFICFGSATTLFYWTKWVATVLSWNRKDTRQKNTTSGDQWTSLLIHSVLMVLLCFAFPAVSKFVVTPYLAGVYGHASAVLSSDNILIMIIMLVLIFVVPMVTMILLRRSHITFEDTYLAGVNTGKQTYFYDAMGEPKHSWITNWYLTDLFGETKLWSPSVVLSTAAILIYTVIALGGAVR